MPFHSTLFFKRSIVIPVLISIFASMIPVGPMVQAIEASIPRPGGGLETIRNVGAVDTIYGLVAILVDEDTWDARTSGEGEFSYLGNTKLSQKIETYAEDVQAALPWTKTMIITVDDDDSTPEIHRMLERLYFEGDPNDNHNTQLTGVVVIGDGVPLPVVNKNEHRFLSTLPYTDFYEPSYILNEYSLDFVVNTQAQNLQADVWHGLIVPPVDGQDGYDLLGQYFEKNHAYHDGDELYTSFNEKVFVGDFVTEESTINSVSFASYQRFLNLWEEIAFYHYSSSLLEDLVLEMTASVEAGDGLDNDADGKYDEEAQNGIDDDGDGLIDEDIGDGFNGIDNDEDGDIDEDGLWDNNNDVDWEMTLGGGDWFEDQKIDEDPPGDVTGGDDLDGDGKPDGDGCPGLCGVDDSGYAEDHDGDDYPSGIEIVFGYDWQDSKRPWRTIGNKLENLMNDAYGTSLSFANDEEAIAWAQDQFTDGFFKDHYLHASCYDTDGSAHPEWDDDEDGFCDEDGSTEVTVWSNDSGSRYSGTCVYNDGDCDGSTDEDPEGMTPEARFGEFPDIQAKSVVETLISRYTDLFQQPQGVWNRLVHQTGRYETQVLDEEENAVNDYDSAVSLIAKKDEFTLQYLDAVNRALESELSDLVEDELQEEIPVIGAMEIYVEYWDEDKEKWKDACNELDGSPDLDKDGCVQFVNHTVSKNWDTKSYKDITNNSGDTNDIFINGQYLWDIERVHQCSNAGGAYTEDGGQLVDFNLLYSFEDTSDIESKEDYRAISNCVPDMLPIREDLPYVCNGSLIESPIKSNTGATMPSTTEDLDGDGQIEIYEKEEQWERGFGACFEFRELSTYYNYKNAHGEEFNDWIAGKVRKLRKNGGIDDEEDYEEFLENAQEVIDDYEVGTQTLKKKFGELDMFQDVSGTTYTVYNMFQDLGLGSYNEDEMDLFLALDNYEYISDPSYGSGMSDIGALKIHINKAYLEEDSVNNRETKAQFTYDSDEAYMISSVYKHTQPWKSVLNDQIEAVSVPNLPIDKIRKISFYDGNSDREEITLNYLNVFNAETVEDVEDMLQELSDAVGEVSGGSVYTDDVLDWMDLINDYQLEDALEWMHMNVDEKHKYVLESYIGLNEPIIGKSRDGYELVSIIADGTATELYGAFNGDKPETEGDLEWQYRNQEAIDAALAAAAAYSEDEYEDIGGLEGYQPVVLSEWLQAIQDWFEELNDSLSSFDVYEGGTYCATPTASGNNIDLDDDGIPDDANATVSITLSSDDNNILQAGGVDYYIVSASARKADGSLNTSDSFTQVELDIISGHDSIDFSGSSHITFTGGIATFALRSGDESGSFTLEGSAVNRSDVSDSNNLSGTVTAKSLHVSTYITDDVYSEGETVEGDLIQIWDEDENVRAVFDPNTGALELRDAEAEIRESTSELPLRVAVTDGEGLTYGVIFLIPDDNTLAVGDGIRGVYVTVNNDDADTESAEEGIYLLHNEQRMGLITDKGQLAVSEGYYLNFSNAGEINLYDPIRVVSSSGITLFYMTIRHDFIDLDDIYEVADSYENYLSLDLSWPRALRGQVIAYPASTWIASAMAATGILDTDGDLLDDLEEWTIGTDRELEDTDSDTIDDGDEIFNGLNPNGPGALFSDIDPSHEAYDDVVTLYLRGVIKGFTDGSFRPENPLSREEFVKMDLGAICIACDNFADEYLDELFSIYNQDQFPDTDINPELLACVAEAKVQGIVSGYAGGDEEGYFVPRQPISRSEATKVLVETAGLDVDDLDEGDIWYIQYIVTAQEYGLFPEGRFDELDNYDSSEFYTWAISDPTFKDWIEGYISRSEFAMMAVNLIDAQDCRSIDTDGDGLSDTEEEYIYGTEPNMEDTDLGGVSDFEEVVRGSDPLDPVDDFEDIVAVDEDFTDIGDFDHAPGVYGVSDNMGYEEIAVSTGVGAAVISIFTNEQAADGESTLFVRAEVRDENDYIYIDDDTSVVEFILTDTEHGDVTTDRVQVNNGVAETVFVTSRSAGELNIEARLTDGSLPSTDTFIKVYPGAPVSLTITGESSVLPAGGESATDMRIELFDTFGNIANNSFYQISIEADADMEILDIYDENTSIEGTQITTSDGYLDFRVLSSPDAVVGTVTATITDVIDGGDSFSIDHIENLYLEVETTEPYMFAGDTGAQEINIRAVDHLGQTLTGFQEDINLSISDPSFGNFTEDEISLVAGAAVGEFSVASTAGDVVIIADSPGLEGGSENLEVKPDSTYELRIRTENGASILNAGERLTFIIDAYDVHGNLATTDSSTAGSIRFTTSTEDFGTLYSTSFTLNQGSAEFDMRPDDISGIINLVASSGDLLAGTWGGEIKYSISGEEISEIEPQMLYASVLGAPFGDVTQEDYIGGWLTFNGKTQAITSLLSEPVPKARVAGVDAEGNIMLTESSLVTLNALGASSDFPMRFQWRNYPDDKLIGEVIYVFPSDTDIETTLLTLDPDIEVEESNGEWLIRDDRTVAAKIREDGQVVLQDSNYSIGVSNDSEGLGLVISKATEQILLVEYDANWTKDVRNLGADADLTSWSSYSKGIYIKPTPDVENLMVNIPTGNNSLAPMGMAIIDPEKDLPTSMQPSMGYTSLEYAEIDGSVGWENDNKHLLLYAAGNTVGDSNLFYASEVGTVLGDPTIKITTEGEINDLGFTTDIGSMVYANQTNILEMIPMDYNDDGQEDVILAYANGDIDVLQNVNGARRLQSKGTILKIENGINAIDTGDFNGDGMEDLLIVTMESCFAEEMCLYAYENIGGGFVARNLTIDEIPSVPVQIKTIDLNNDDYTDLVLVDENMVVYVAWNVAGEIKAVDTLRDFGLYTDSGDNLYADILLRYDDLENGSSVLPMATTETVSPSIDTDLQDFVDSLGLNDDFALQIDGIDAAGQTITRMENFEFEYADDTAVANDLYVNKSIDDLDGGTVEVGDTVDVSIFIKNQSGSDYDSVYISDMVTGMYYYDDDSLTCTNCDEDNGNPSILPGSSLRPWIFGPFSIANGERIQLEYTMEAQSLPNVQLLVGQDLQTDYVDDEFADIGVTLEGNNTGQLMVYYSDGYVTETETGEGLFRVLTGTSYKRITYTEKEYSPDTHAADYETEDLSDGTALEDSDDNGVPDIVELMNTDTGLPVPPPGAYDPAKEVLGAEDVNGDGFYTTEELYQSDEDADNDGWNDTIDNWVVAANLLLDPTLQLEAWSARGTNIEDGVSIESDGGDSDSDLEISISADADTLLSIEGELSLFDDEVEAIAQKVEDVVAMFTCNGGCLALPGSVAFLAPGWFHDPFFGVPLMIDTGTPIFGITGMVPPAPPVCFGQSCYVSFTMRTYLAPTTTLGLALGICIGTYPVGKCYAFNLPILQALGVCDAVNGFIADGLSAATEFVSGVNNVFNSDAQGELYGEWDTTGLGSNIFSEYEPPVATELNIQVPGFPSIFTEWFKNQKLEFFKMLDLPDVTFIYPDANSFTSEFTGIKEKAQDNNENSSVDLDSSSVVDAKISELTSGGVLDLEKWLNYAHAIPLIDIKPEPVTIYYPAPTLEELDAFELEATDWVEDAGEEVERFLGLFCLKLDGEKGNRELNKIDNCVADALEPAEQDVLNSLVSVVDDTIGAIEANLAVVESYGDIPLQILEIRTLQAYYAKTIVCYLDVILSKTAGYMSENVQRIEAWMQWAVDMTSIIEGWKILIDLAVDFMDSCDKCTNQRYSGLQLLFSLFVFIPEFPVIELPKLPDIVIDVSHIQAGVDIQWPDINFKPAPIEFPELPRLVLPRADLNLDFDMDIEIPVLPEFNLDFTLPDLPGLVLPDLPSIPPPPSVPEILPEIKIALNISSNILKIICLIRSGFIPTDEMMLKSRVEDITERPGGIILPFDLRLNFEWPGFRKEFLERIEINTYLNLTMDFSGIYDFIDDIGDRSNEFITDGVGEVNQAMIDVVAAIEEVVIPITDIDFSIDAEIDADLDLEGDDSSDSDDLSYNYDHPAFETATMYKDDPLVHNNLLALESSLKYLQSGIDEWAETLPEGNYELVATQRILAADDPLLHQYDDIILDHKDLDSDFLASIESTPLASIAMMRNSMIAYIDDLEHGTQVLNGLDDTGFHRYLAQESGIQPHFLLASNEEDGSVSSAEMWAPEVLVKEDPLEVQLASDVDPSGGLDALDYGSEPYAMNDGIYIFNEEEGVATKLVTYSQESDEGVDILFLDVDDDGDEDVLYSLGGDVYLKENHSNSPTLKYMTSDTGLYSVDDVAPEHGTVKNFRTGKNANEEASFSMNSSYNATAYEVLFYDSMDAMQGEPEENIKRMLLLAREQNEKAILLDESGEEKQQGSPLYASDTDAVFKDEEEEIVIEVDANSDYTLPEIRESRIIVNNVTGTATLSNGYHRVTVSSNGEIETLSDVVLQTLEDTTLVIEKESGNMTIELEANMWIDLRRDVDRVVRVDSGKVIWVDLTDIDEEQEIIEGMELFAGEGITVDGIIAKTEIETSDGAIITLNNDESFSLEDLMSISNPTANIEVENGAYYTRVRGIYSDGNIGTLSSNILLNPQICGDTSSPYPIVDTGDGTTEVAIFKTKEISAESSFDSDSEIVSAVWDLDISVDSDEDGDPENDVDATGLVANIGPYDNTDPKEVLLTITDTAGNTASTKVDVEIYVPEIEIEEALTTQVTGTTDPATETFPFYLVREREDSINEIGSGQYLTDDFGDFLIDDLSEDELLNVVDITGATIAQFNPVTHQVIVLMSGYDVTVVEAGNGWPAHLSVYETSTGLVMASFILVADDERSIVVSDDPLEEMNLSLQESVTVYFEDGSESGYEITDSLLTARDPNGYIDLMIEADGNINLYDSSRYDLVKRDAESLDEYMIIELYDYGILEMEIWVGSPDEVSIQTTDDLGLSASELIGDDGDLSADTRMRFEDISEDDPLYEDILELVERGVIEGVEIDGLRYFLPDDDINRAEFTKIVLSILCIVPRDEAYLEPSVFNDILSVLDWFFPFTKEAYLSDLITGYIGEIDASGQTPFKPNNTITRAEAVKIMIEALISEGVIEDLEANGVIEELPEPWYEPYIEIAQDLSPYMVTSSTQGEEIFIITPEEAADPLHVITRYEFVEMSVRVLQAHNCFDLDSDGDGLINYDEETLYGTDPYNPDSDSGGVTDGDEVLRGTDPLDGEDDFEDSSQMSIFEPGMYAVREACYSCPCTGNIDWDADLRAGDQVFAIIRNDEETIFGVSNKVYINE